MSYLAVIFVGIVAGWLAEKVMKVDMPTWKNLLLGLGGAAIGSIVLSIVGYQTSGGTISAILVAFLGSCLILWVWKKVKGDG